MKINVKKILLFLLKALFILLTLVFTLFGLIALGPEHIFLNYYSSSGFEWLQAIRTVIILAAAIIALYALCLMIVRSFRKKQTIYHAIVLLVCGAIFFITSGGITFYYDYLESPPKRYPDFVFDENRSSKPVDFLVAEVNPNCSQSPVPGRVVVQISLTEKERLKVYLTENKLLSKEAFPEDMFPSQAEDPEFFVILTVEDGKEKYWIDKIKADLPFVKSAESDYYACDPSRF